MVVTCLLSFAQGEDAGSLELRVVVASPQGGWDSRTCEAASAVSGAHFIGEPLALQRAR
jgi:hypothetical protein